jgi:hypothetical protein
MVFFRIGSGNGVRGLAGNAATGAAPVRKAKLPAAAVPFRKSRLDIPREHLCLELVVGSGKLIRMGIQGWVE